MENPCIECLVKVMCLNHCDSLFQYITEAISDLAEIPDSTDYLQINMICDSIRKQYLGRPAPRAIGWGICKGFGMEVSIDSKTNIVTLTKFSEGVPDVSKSL